MVVVGGGGVRRRRRAASSGIYIRGKRFLARRRCQDRCISSAADARGQPRPRIWDLQPHGSFAACYHITVALRARHAARPHPQRFLLPCLTPRPPAAAKTACCVCVVG